MVETARGYAGPNEVPAGYRTANANPAVMEGRPQIGPVLHKTNGTLAEAEGVLQQIFEKLDGPTPRNPGMDDKSPAPSITSITLSNAARASSVLEGLVRLNQLLG